MLRHRVSGLTICPLGQPEKAIGLEPQIEPWLALYNRTACLRQKPKGVVTPTSMNLAEKENHERLAPLRRLDGQGKSSLLPVDGEVFLLTSPFIERRYRPSEIGSDSNVRLPD